MTGLEFEGFQYQSENAGQEPAESDSSYIDYSIKVVELLKGKMKDYNKNHSSRITVAQLKEVYREAGKINSCGKWCLAKVNMFLRMKAGENVYQSKPKPDAKEISTLELEINESSHQDTFDVSETLYPSEEDFELATKEIESNELNLDFKNIDNLYLEEYKKIDFDWS